jgi:hypothetical protein
MVVVVLLCVQWVQLRWEVTVRFVDGIDDHYCLSFRLTIVKITYYY